MVEQIPKANASSFAKASRKERADTVFQPELVLGDELHDDRRHEALRDAPRPERVVGTSLSAAHLGLPRRHDGAFAVLLDERDHRRDVARGDQAVRRLLELRLGGRGRTDDDGAAADDGNRDREGGDELHVLSTRRAASALHGYFRRAQRV